MLRFAIRWLVVLLLIFVAVFLFAMYGEEYYDRIRCFTSGDKYLEMKDGQRYCVKQYVDGGKACTHSDQCSGSCLVWEDTTVAQPLPKPTGFCSRYSVLESCIKGAPPTSSAGYFRTIENEASMWVCIPPIF